MLLAQALFSRPDVLLLDEPTNNLDIHSIRWLERVLNDYDATMIIISHDRHFLNQVCTHIADLDYQQLKIYPGNYDDFMLASVQARQRVEASNAKAKAQISDLQEFVRRFSANASKARQATSRKRQIEKIKIEEIKPVVAAEPVHPLRAGEEAVPLGRHGREPVASAIRAPTVDIFSNLNFTVEAGERIAIIGPNGIGKTTLMRCLAGDLTPTTGRDHLGRERAARLHAAGSAGGVRAEDRPVRPGCRPGPARPTTTRSCAPRSAACCSPATRPRSRSRCCRAARRAA